MNGNIVTEQDSEIGEESEPVARQAAEKNGVYSQDYGWALTKDGDGTKANENNVYSRTYEWDSRNELVQSSDQSYTTVYVYGDDGQRTNKMSNDGETMYFSKM